MSASSSAQDDVWVAVMAPLYERARAACPGSLDERIAETALEYAINAFADGRPLEARPPAFAIHDHLRNARHNAARTWRREALGFQRVATGATASGATRANGLVEYRGPEDCALADDFLRRLRSQVGNDTNLTAVLDGTLRELPTALISSQTRIPLRSVERLRARIREAAANLAA